MKKFILSLILSTIFTCLAKEVNGKVIAVLDGDTFILLDSLNLQHHIRLSGIDAPEKNQPFGTKAKEMLSAFVFKMKVRVTYNDIDRYGRILGLVETDRLNINELMVSSGFAWAYLRYLYEGNTHYISLEESARKQKLGLWADSNPIAPWDFRHK